MGCRPADIGQVALLHLVLTEIVRVEALEPFAQPLGVVLVRCEVEGLRVVDDGVLDEDRRSHTEGERNGVARARVDRDHFPVDPEVNECVEGVLLKIANDDFLDVSLEVADHI